MAGTFTNNAGAVFVVASNGMPNEMANVGTLVNNGDVEVDAGTLNLTNQPNGVTDVRAGTSIVLFGTLTAGSKNGLFDLGSIEGALTLANGQKTVVTPSSGTLKNTGVFNLEDGTSVVVNGNLTNSGQVRPLGTSETLTVTSTFTNQADGVLNFSNPPASNSSLT